MRRYALSNWRIRTRLTALLILPVIAAMVLGGFRIQASLQTQQQLSKASQLGELAQSATLLATALEDERDTSAGIATAKGDKTADAIAAAFKITTTRQINFTKLTNNLNFADLPGNGVDIKSIDKNLDGIALIRQESFAHGGSNILQSVNAYDGLIKPLLTLSQDIALASSNSALIQSTRALQEFSQWKEDQSIIRAVISASLASNPVALQPGDRAYAAAAQTDAQNAESTFEGLYSGGVAAAKTFSATWANNINVKRATAFSNTVLSTGEGFAAVQNVPQYSDWDAEATTQISLMGQAENVLVLGLNAQTSSLSSAAKTDAIVNSVLIGLVLLVAIVGAVIVARSMVRTLSRMQHAAEDVAENRLPELVRTLSESDPQDVDTSVAPIGINTTDEIGHVARAFDQVHAQAVRLAAEQALLRGNINAMFTNLSRRSQGLIQRQLSMISELESREADPDQLASLFKLDHLATRMRRNGENLLVLAGEDPGRRWTRPVPLVDVLRAAASEVEQYERIELASVPTADVAGRVVNDLVHLLAELLENATSFSSPQTRVRVTGHALPDGRVLVEIHDTGIGLSPDDLAEINERLANPPVVDVSVSRRMGLFVVGRLSLRHGIRIQLRPSDSGGTTALVMLPVDVTNAAERRGGAAGPGQQRPQGAPGQNPGGPGGVGMQQQRGAMPQTPGRAPLSGGPAGGPGGRPSLPPQPAPQPGLPRRSDTPGLPQGSSPMGAPAPGGRPGGQQQPAHAQQDPTLQSMAQQGGPQQRGPQGPFAPQQPQQQGMQSQGLQPPVPLDEQGLWAEQPQHGSPAPTGRPAARPQGPDAMDSTAQFARPHFDEEPARPIPPQPTPPRPVEPQSFAPQQPQQPQRPPQAPSQPVPPQQQVPSQPAALPVPDAASHPLTRALPPAEAGAGSSPIFEAMESNWFRSGRADRMRAVQVTPTGPDSPEQAPAQAPAPQRPSQNRFQRPGTSAPQPPVQQGPGSVQPPQQSQYPQRPGTSAPSVDAPFGAPPQRPMPQRGVGEGMPSGASATGQWRTSANDEVWRRAEQVREPSAGGVLPSGLPRRVPKANLVPGTAESAPAEGPQPQVSRSPEEVRGRLTNLRRGIQQGRQAGAGGSNQPNPGGNAGPYGTNPQER
ncbi:nitrate- and nitrite sensing domain-containing protein [Streptacidiphilus sp. N1-10]|uniref:histidine kinase n=1 Tax=Streptacidiphilus jeojiensis TaxID=3229225 RepID=A0ABV6XS41_9ACTN